MKNKFRTTPSRDSTHWLNVWWLFLSLWVSFAGMPRNLFAQCNVINTHTVNGTEIFNIDGTTQCPALPPGYYTTQGNDITINASAQLQVNFINGFVPQAGDQFILYSYTNSFTGSFLPANVDIDAVSGIVFELIYNTSSSPYTLILKANAPEIELSGNGNPIALNSTTPSPTNHTDFGEVNFSGSGSIARIFTISNTGTSDLVVNTINITGTHALDFTLSGISFPATITPGNSTNFTVTFDPSAVGTRSATVSINSNDIDDTPIRNPFAFDIQGKGTTPVA